MPNRNQLIFYAKPYPGRFTDYVPDHRTVHFQPTVIMEMESDDMFRIGSTHARTLHQGRQSVQCLHTYAYGRSNPVLRPRVDAVDDELWLMDLDENYIPPRACR